MTTADLVAALRQFQLLEPAQQDELPGLQARYADPKALARELMRRDWLTPYQGNQLLQGRGSELLLGSYVLLERLGEGGMGAVFKARNWKLGQVVALKLIRKEHLDVTTAVTRFQREIRACARLNHPNVVRALDADEVDGTHLLIMELVDGTDLARRVKRSGPLAVGQACDIIRQAALGLQHAHEHGLVHRDIKPSNLLVTAQGTVKILDLGLARLAHTANEDSASPLTEAGAIMGTPDYLAPELARQAHDVDVRADLYSLGCTLYFLLTGRVPFPGGTLAEKLVKHQLDEPVPMNQLRPEVPPSVARVVRKLMAKRPEDRYQTPADLVGALDRLTNGEGPPSDDPLDTAERWARVVDPGNTVAYLPSAIPRRRRGRLVTLVGGLAVVALGVWAIASSRHQQPNGLPPPGVDRRVAQAPSPAHAPFNGQQARAHQEAWAKYLGTPVEITNAIGMKLAVIPAGTFRMGSPNTERGREDDGREGPQHPVSLTRPFYMGVHPVTVGQFRAFVLATKYRTQAEKGTRANVRQPNGEWKADPAGTWNNPRFAPTDAHPVVCITWNDAQEFCAWLSRTEHRRYTLPTEAQWEYCCRAGSQTRFFFGDSDSALTDYAWYGFNSGMQTHPVGLKEPNAWGLHDMPGNVHQWCQDYYDARYYEKSPPQDPTGPPVGDWRVMRGSAWGYGAAFCRSACRATDPPSSRNDHIGFRVIKVPDIPGRGGG